MDIRKAGVVGGGVIGAGWAARFLLNGIDVAIYDPDPEIGRKVGAVLENARLAAARLTPGVLPAEGTCGWRPPWPTPSRAPISCRKACPSARI